MASGISKVGCFVAQLSVCIGCARDRLAMPSKDGLICYSGILFVKLYCLFLHFGRRWWSRNLQGLTKKEVVMYKLPHLYWTMFYTILFWALLPFPRTCFGAVRFSLATSAPRTKFLHSHTGNNIEIILKDVARISMFQEN